MPWFQTPEISGYWGQHWTQPYDRNPEIILPNGRRDIASYYYPLIGTYDSSDPNYLEYAVTLIKLSGIDGIMIDYYGHLDFHDYAKLHEATNLVIQKIKEVGLQFSIVYEDNAANEIANLIDENITNIAIQHIKYLDENYFSDQNYFNLDNQPVLLNFGPIHLKSDEQWLKIFQSINDKIIFLPLTFHSDYYDLKESSDGAFSWAETELNEDFYRYCKELDYCGGGSIFEFRSFKEHSLAINPRNGDQLKESLNRAKENEVDFIQLITWNDHGEGTGIEPTIDYEFHQLTIVQEFLGIQPNPSDLELAVKLYQKRKEFKGDELRNKKLDQVFYYLISFQLDKARDLLNDL